MNETTGKTDNWRLQLLSQLQATQFHILSPAHYNPSSPARKKGGKVVTEARDRMVSTIHNSFEIFHPKKNNTWHCQTMVLVHLLKTPTLKMVPVFVRFQHGKNPRCIFSANPRRLL